MSGFIRKGDEDFARKLKKAGVVKFNYAIESASPEILEVMKKPIKINQFEDQKRILEEVGIESGTCIVLGYPQETKKTIDETFEVLYRNKIYPSVGFLLAAPGSVMYDYVVENGYIDNEEEYLLTIGDRQDMRLNYTQMGSKEFLDYVIHKLKKLRDICDIDIDDDHLIGTTVLEDNSTSVYAR